MKICDEKTCTVQRDARSERDGRTHHANCFATRGHHDCAIAEVNRLRETVKRLNRRCQSAESGLAQKIDEMRRAGWSFGRAFANSAATMYSEQIEELKASRVADPELVARLHRALDFHPKALAVSIEVADVRAVLRLLGGESTAAAGNDAVQMARTKAAT